MSFSDESNSDQEMVEQQPQVPNSTHKSRHYCKFCDKDLKSSHLKNEDFMKHLDRCRKYFKYVINGSTCKICQKFKSEKLGPLLNHIEKIHAKELFEKDNDKQQSLEEKDFTENIGEDTIPETENTREREGSISTKPFSCDGCLKKFKYNMGLKKHKINCQNIEKSGPSPEIANQTGNAFSNSDEKNKNSNFEEHDEEMKSNINLADDEAFSGSEKDFPVISNRKKSNNIKMRNCEYCNLEKNAKYYREHVKKCAIYSKLVPNNICQICTKDFGLPITNINQKTAYSHLSKRHRSLINQKDDFTGKNGGIVNKQLNSERNKQNKPPEKEAVSNQSPKQSNFKPPPIAVKREKIAEEMVHSEDDFTKKNGSKILETEEDPSEILGDVLDDSSIGSNGPIEIDDNDDIAMDETEYSYSKSNADAKTSSNEKFRENDLTKKYEDNDCKILSDDPRVQRRKLANTSTEVEILNSPNPYAMPMLVSNNKNGAKQFRTFMQNKDPRMISQLYICPVCKGKFFTVDIVQDHLSQFHKIPTEHQQRLNLEINIVAI